MKLRPDRLSHRGDIARCLTTVAVVGGVLLGSARALCAQGDGYERQRHVDVQSYRFGLTLSDGSDSIEGETVIDVRWLERAGELTLDLDGVDRGGDGAGRGMSVLEVSEHLADGSTRTLSWDHRFDRLRVEMAEPMLPGSRSRIVVRYRGLAADGFTISSNKHGDRTFFADNWPNRAHYWLPVIDHPYDKARCAFDVTAPDHYQVIGCGRLREETDLNGGLRRTVWQSDAPMATKVMAVGVARFAVEKVGDVDGIGVETWVFPQDRDAGFSDFGRAERVLQVLSDLIGPYPYSKLANVQSKTRWGGLENASNIFYNERSVRGDGSNESLLAHEIAHQWFGDSVTESDWAHVWLSEGFATYVTELYTELTYGRDRMNQRMRRAAERVFTYTEANPQRAIVDTVDREVDKVLSPLTYQKGAWVLHMLRHEIGDRAFFDGLREYYRTFRDSNVMTSDFRQVMETVSGRDLRAFFERWLERPGHPQIAGWWRFDGGELEVELGQQQSWEPFAIRPEIRITGEDGQSARLPLEFVGRTASVRRELDFEPTMVELDPDGWLLLEVRSFERLR